MGRRARKKGARRGSRGIRIGGMVLLVVASLTALGALVLQVKVWVHRSPLFILRQVEVAGHETLCADEILTLCSLRDGADLFEIDIRALGETVEKHPCVRKAVVTRRLPDRLVVRVIERVPVAQVLTGRWCEIDEAGVVLGPVRPEFEHELPKFFGVRTDGVPDPGTVLDDSVTTRLLALVAALNRPPLRDWGFEQRLTMFLVSEDGSLMIPVDSSSAMVLVGREDWTGRLAKLAVVEPYQEDPGPQPELIDLRFEDLVVVGSMPKWGRELARAFSGA